MKARRVKGIDAESSFRDGCARIISVRLAELLELAPAAIETAESAALHDLRIAAKRLRYVLELSEPCYGDLARRGAKRARALQDVLGELHDCDVLAPMIRAHEEAVRSADADALLGMPGTASDPAAVSSAPGARLHRGLAVLAVHVRARRAALYSEFVSEWRRLERSGTAEDLREAVGL